jgi:hypothetical protein
MVQSEPPRERPWHQAAVLRLPNERRERARLRILPTESCVDGRDAVASVADS